MELSAFTKRVFLVSLVYDKNRILCVTTLGNRLNLFEVQTLMKLLARPVLLFLATVLTLGTLGLSSCTVRSGAHITKVNPYHFFPGKTRPRTEEQMIDFEYRRKIYGAVDRADYFERHGNYFTIHWKTENRTLPVTVRLQYRQSKTGPKIFAEDKVVNAPKRANTTHFEIIGDNYAQRGSVTQWKASIIQEGVVVDEYKSFLWQ